LVQVEQFAIRFPGIEDSAGQIEAQLAGAVIAIPYFVSNFGV
jgi:hypothetical protein